MKRDIKRKWKNIGGKKGNFNRERCVCFKWYIKNIKLKFPPLDLFQPKKDSYFQKSITQILYAHKSIFSFHFKKQYKCKINQNTHPAFKTRRDNNIYVPDFEMFKISYIKIFSMPIPLYLKSFLFEQINRER